MAVKFYYDNLVKNSLIEASSVNLEFPIDNIKDDRRTKVFRSNTNNDYLVFDFGSFVEIDSFCIVNSSLGGFKISKLTLEFNNSNFWTSPAFSQEIDLDYEFGFGFYEFSSIQNFRFARILMESSSGFCEISNVFFGKRLEDALTDFSYPLNFKKNSLSTKQVNRYGQKFIDEIVTQKTISGKIDYISSEFVDDFDDFINYVSTTVPFFVRFESVSMFKNMNRINGHYYFQDEPILALSTGNYWTCSMMLEEGL